jgi:acyl-CoA thioesterase FadM
MNDFCPFLPELFLYVCYQSRKIATIEENKRKGERMRRQFCQTHTVRYDECNCDGFLTPTAFLRYMQNIAALDAEDAQLGGDGYWVIKRTVISFAEPVPMYTKLELRTYGIGFTRITAQRGYEARIVGKQPEQPVVSARSLWVYVDPRGRPMRLPEDTARIWLPDGPLPQQPEQPFPAFPERAPISTEASIRFSDIDLMRHLNNAAVVELLDNAAWDAYATGEITPDTAQFAALSYDIEYIDSPRFGEQLTIQSWLDPFPTTRREFSRFQQIVRDEKVMVRAYSRWLRKA